MDNYTFNTYQLLDTTILLSKEEKCGQRKSSIYLQKDLINSIEFVKIYSLFYLSLFTYLCIASGSSDGDFARTVFFYSVLGVTYQLYLMSKRYLVVTTGFVKYTSTIDEKTAESLVNWFTGRQCLHTNSESIQLV